jgi:hypothetical protein
VAVKRAHMRCQHIAGALLSAAHALGGDVAAAGIATELMHPKPACASPGASPTRSRLLLDVPVLLRAVTGYDPPVFHEALAAERQALVQAYAAELAAKAEHLRLEQAVTEMHAHYATPLNVVY